MDEILKAYGRHSASDDLMHILSEAEYGFDPLFWISRGKAEALQEPYRRYGEYVRKINCMEFMKGQAYGL